MLIDSHCHLDYLERDGADLNEVLRRATQAGVDKMLTISTRMDTYPAVKAIAQRYQNVWCSVGVHPHEAEKHEDVSVQDLCVETEDQNVIAIGETGLDYFYDHSPRDLQRKSFENHLQAACDTELPVIVHTRQADEDTITMLKTASESGQGKLTGLIHCFSSTAELAEKSLELGFYISISGIVTFKKATELQEIVKTVPLDRLLVETDAPYLAPIPHRGKTNEPAFVSHTAQKIADLKQISVEEVAQKTSENFYRLFKRAQMA